MHDQNHDWDVRHAKTGIDQTTLCFTVRCGDGALMNVYLTKEEAEKLALALLDAYLEGF